MYKEARKQAGLSLDEAAYRLSVAPRTLAKYEAGELRVPCEIVVKMAEIYREPELVAWHCATQCAAGRLLKPVYESGELATNSLALLKELNDVNACMGRLVAMAADGRITLAEEVEFERVMQELAELKAAIERMELLAQKMRQERRKAAA